MKYIHLTDGRYLGFISGNNLFSRDGLYLGWLEGDMVWGKNGEYRGTLTEMGGNNYILRQVFAVSPIPRVPKVPPVSPAPPVPVSNIVPIITPLGYSDGFKG
ncbi:MAG TPA: hypothetical protein VLF59_00905 [Candidatus Saccharimonadales bacterium]|nr:hypothetical protein [Candidatus Saccharimonadales bacterium]